ncbi:MAG: glycosyltransferase family 4 protein [Planctomycetaceae bacterium]|nr:glycosyltransferase family 4 protein [Planctomycetaceae bacterium]MBV8229766.1 glycosyltransferase family 4 protein [Planctomycetaceae bacterium]MBV8269892.1 glycosyltransferase family 4 protein [Planctomycetaceae bacterium]MBV8315693.1 glycosyltransferase family 4 protein [Planctomycetaceae bacterium]
MKICILYQHYLRPGDAGHNRFNDYARIWSGLGHKVSVITGQASYMTGIKAPQYHGRFCVREVDGPVDVYRMYVPDQANESFLRRGASYLAFALSSAWGYRGLDRPSVLLCSSPPLFAGLGMLLIRRFSRVPIVFEVRDLWPESAVATGVIRNRSMIRLMYALERRCYAAAQRVNVLTDAFREDILARGLADPAKVCFVPNGVDTEQQRPELRSERLREELGWAGRFVVLYSGAHGVANRVGQLLDAAELLRDRSEILIATVGSGMDLEPLRREADRRGLTNVRLHGPRPREQMPAITASADACAAVLQRNDTFRTVYPNKVFDAMACGRPIVLGIDGVARDLVERSGAGLFAEPEDPRALADAILRLSDDRSAAEVMGCRGREFVTQNFDRNRLAMRYLDVLQSVARDY